MMADAHGGRLASELVSQSFPCARFGLARRPFNTLKGMRLSSTLRRVAGVAALALVAQSQFRTCSALIQHVRASNRALAALSHWAGTSASCDIGARQLQARSPWGARRSRPPSDTRYEPSSSPKLGLQMLAGPRPSGGDGVNERNSAGDAVVKEWVDAGKKWLVGLAMAGTLIGGGTGLSPGMMGAPEAAFAGQEMKEVGICLLGECQGELASCLLNPKCFANIICLNTCTGKPDEAYCQIRCGDLFENDAVGKFNACAVSKKNCVKQRQDDGSWPVPPRESMVRSFNTKMMEGRWYISAGLNPAFDCFDCQVHFFNSPSNGKLVGKLNWRIKEPDGEFFTRDVVQKFQQDPDNPAHLVNKDNEYLHYRDDWYILDAEKDSHVLVVYRGSNDAWDGYGGGTLYTKEKTVPANLVERLREKTAAAGIDWERFQYNDNSCKPQDRETEGLLRQRYARKVLLSGGEQLQEQLTAVRGFAKQEVEGVESVTLEALEKLREEYQAVEEGIVDEAGKLEDDLVKAFESELQAFEETVKDVKDGAESLSRGASRIEKKAEDIVTGGMYKSKDAQTALSRLEQKFN